MAEAVTPRAFPTAPLDPGPAPGARTREHLLRRVPGHETLFVELEPGGAMVCKRFRGRGAAREARTEHENLRALAALGLCVPESLGWTREVGGARVELAFVRHRATLRELAARAGPAERRARAAELLELVLRLHDAGWYHRDLYLSHLLVRSEDHRLCLIDVGRARRRRRPRRRWFVKDLAALLHSTPGEVPVLERLRFAARYLDRRGVRGRSARRRWLRAVAAKARRIARHVPKESESHPIPAEWRG